ncbi:hypothetical protein BaRGS_00027695, partial [Batillaria attramentaria]
HRCTDATHNSIGGRDVPLFLCCCGSAATEACKNRTDRLRFMNLPAPPSAVRAEY